MPPDVSDLFRKVEAKRGESGAAASFLQDLERLPWGEGGHSWHPFSFISVFADNIPPEDALP